MSQIIAQAYDLDLLTLIAYHKKSGQAIRSTEQNSLYSKEKTE